MVQERLGAASAARAMDAAVTPKVSKQAIKVCAVPGTVWLFNPVFIIGGANAVPDSFTPIGLLTIALGPQDGSDSANDTPL